MARVFTREQFYELVWSKPMTHLAKEFAISDVALHKMCKKHGIPNPPLGWWAKKSAGHIVKQTPLPATEPGFPGKIVLADPDLTQHDPVLARVREEARILASDLGPEEGEKVHPIVERTLAKLRKSKPSALGLVSADDVGLIKCEIAPNSIERLAVILRRLVSAASRQGFELSAEQARAHFNSQIETVSFQITEILGREKHVLTETEIAKQQTWERKRAVALRRGSMAVLFEQPNFPDWDHRPTGNLSIEFEHIYLFGRVSPRRSFRDGKTQRLENMTSDIGVGLAVIAAAKTERRLEQEAERRKMEEARRQRELAARIKHIEERRVSGLNEIMLELDELDRLRRLLRMLSAEGIAGPTLRVSTFLEWANSRLAKLESRFSATAIESRFEAARLFGDMDDHAFVQSRW